MLYLRIYVDVWKIDYDKQVKQQFNKTDWLQ